MFRSVLLRVPVILLLTCCEFCFADPSQTMQVYATAITSATVIGYGTGVVKEQINQLYGKTPLEKDTVRILRLWPGVEYLDTPTSTVAALVAPNTAAASTDFLELMKPFEVNWFSYTNYVTDTPDKGFMYWKGNSIVVILFNGTKEVMDNPTLRKSPKSLDLLYNLYKFVDNARMGSAPSVRLKRLR